MKDSRSSSLSKRSAVQFGRRIPQPCGAQLLLKPRKDAGCTFGPAVLQDIEFPWAIGLFAHCRRVSTRGHSKHNSLKDWRCRFCPQTSVTVAICQINVMKESWLFAFGYLHDGTSDVSVWRQSRVDYLSCTYISPLASSAPLALAPNGGIFCS